MMNSMNAHLNSLEEAIAYAFEDEVSETNPRRQDPLDMCKDMIGDNFPSFYF